VLTRFDSANGLLIDSVSISECETSDPFCTNSAQFGRLDVSRTGARVYVAKRSDTFNGVVAHSVTPDALTPVEEADVGFPLAVDVVTSDSCPTLPTETPTSSPPASTPTRTGTATGIPTQTTTPTPGPCFGDCNENVVVTVSEIVTAVGIALGHLPLDACPVADRDTDQRVTVDELIGAVTASIYGCRNP
jgi:hypothetical protein